MKKGLLFVLVLLASALSYSTYASSCDADFYYELRQGHSYEFYDDYTNPSSTCEHVLAGFDISKPSGINFQPIGNGKISSNSTERILQSNNVTINDTAPFTIVYDISYNKVCGGISDGPYNHVECAHYTITYCGDGVVNGGEQCDDGNDIDDDACSNSCEINKTPPPTPAICGPRDGDVIYDFDNAGDALTANSSGLCAAGDTVINFTYSNHRWTWKCTGDGGESDLCSASETRCGDGVVNGGEQCDDGNDIDDDACSNSCTIPTPNLCPDGTDRAGQQPTTPGSSCDDGNPDTTNDKIDSTGCNCAGTPNLCPDGTDRAGKSPATPGASCDDGNPDTINDRIDSAGCNCAGTPNLCPDGTDRAGQQPATPGASCDDGDPNTTNDRIDSTGCNCAGTPPQPESVCEDLYISKTMGNVPFTSTFTCTGKGNNFQIILSDGGSILHTRAAKKASYQFTKAGTYTVQCLVDGKSGAVCEHGSADGIMADQSLQPGQTMRSYEQQLQDNQSHAIVEDTMNNLDMKNISPATSYTPSVRLQKPYKQIAASNASVEKVVQGVCHDPCVGKVIAKEPTTKEPICLDISLDPSISVVKKSSHTTSVSCTFANITASDTVKLACGNGDTLEAQGKTTLQKDCSYDEYGTYTPTCTVETSVCSTNLTLKKGTDTGGNNYCGDGIHRPDLGEECDDGNAIDGDGCSANCKLEYPSGGPYCGDGILDAGEECDEGKHNGLGSICSAQCNIKGLTLEGPKCSFVDPPSIQMGEFLPFRWGTEEDERVSDSIDCPSGIVDDPADAEDIGKIDRDSMLCHFSFRAPNGASTSFSKPCYTREDREYARWRDMLRDADITLENNRGRAVFPTELFMQQAGGAVVFGEYTLTLDAIDYALCTGKGIEYVDSDGRQAVEIEMKGMQNYSYHREDSRVCQYNLAVTTPYMMQKGVTLSSLPDDMRKLAMFQDVAGNAILDNTQLTPIESITTTDAAEELTTILDTYRTRASQQVMDVTSDAAGLSTIVRRVPAQEIYYIDGDVTLAGFDATNPFNKSRPTTLLVDGRHTVRIVGDLHANIFVVAPESVVEFVNIDCDTTDTVQGLFLADHFISTQDMYGTSYPSLANNMLDKPLWCAAGDLIIEGILIGGSDNATWNMRDTRRSTLHNRFDDTLDRDRQIFDGAALQVKGAIQRWDNLPPLAKSLMDSLRIMKN